LEPLVVLPKFDVYLVNSLQLSLNERDFPDLKQSKPWLFFSPPQFCDLAKLLIISKKLLKPIFGYIPDMKFLKPRRVVLYFGDLLEHLTYGNFNFYF
jgi:hypothetical protein